MSKGKLLERGLGFTTKLIRKPKTAAKAIKSATRGLRNSRVMKGGTKVLRRGASSIKKGAKAIGKVLKPIMVGTVAAIPWLFKHLFSGNENQQEQAQRDQQVAENAVIPEIKTEKPASNDKNNSSESQLGLSKDQTKLDAEGSQKSAALSKAALSTYTKAQTEISSLLSNLETSGIAAKVLNDKFPGVVEPKNKIEKLPTPVEKEVKTTGALGVVGLQHLFGKIDGVKDSVIEVGKMLYAAQDIQIKQNNEQIKHLAELQKIIKSQGRIEGVQASADITEKQVNVDKDKVQADTSRKIKAAADKAYEEATNANAEARATEKQIRTQAATERLSNIRKRLGQAFKPSKAAKVGAGILGAAALAGGLKKIYDNITGKSDEEPDEDENILEDEDGNAIGRIDEQGNAVDFEGNPLTDEEGNQLNYGPQQVDPNQLEDFTDEEGNTYTADKNGKGYTDRKGNHYTIGKDDKLQLDKLANPWANAGLQTIDWLGNNADNIYTGYLGWQGLKAAPYMMSGKMTRDALTHAGTQVTKAATREGIAEADKLVLKELEQELIKAQEKAAAGRLSKAAEKAIMTKVLSKLGTKATVGKIPGIGLLINGAFAVDDWKNGDYAGAVLNVLSGIASIVPGYGTAVSYVLDGINCILHLNQQHSPEWVRNHQGGSAAMTTYRQAHDNSTETRYDRYGNPYTAQIAVRDAVPDTQSYWQEKEHKADRSATLRKLMSKTPGVERRSKGGIIPGNPANGDSVPALLQPGEFVMPVDLVNRLMSALEAGGNDDRGNSSPTVLNSPKVVTHPRVITPSPKPPIVRDTKLNPKTFEDSVVNKNFDIASAVGVANELPSYDLASGEDSNKPKDPLEASIKGICARYIRAALEAGGINTQNHPGEAYEYAKWLPKQGFREVDGNSKLLPGDISVEDRTDESPHGHISMWTGTQWVSDRFQNSRVVTPPGKHGKLVLLRHRSMPLTDPQDNTDYGKDDFDYGVDNNKGVTFTELEGALTNLPSNVMSIISNSSDNKRSYVNIMRTKILNALKTKSFINQNDVEAYADLLTAQTAHESNYGTSNLATSRLNFGGLTKGCGKYHAVKDPTDNSKWEKFASIDDYIDDYIEYLNRKWKAFDAGPLEFFNQLQHSKINSSAYCTSPAGDEYTRRIMNNLNEVRAIASIYDKNYYNPYDFDSEPNELALAAVEKSKSGKFYSDSRKGYVNLNRNEYKGLCTSGPETWYREAGGPNLHGSWWNTGSPRTATETNISKKGFSEVWSGTAEQARSNAMQPLVKPGDILVSFGTKKNGQNSAHAQMWNGSQWLSDTRQDSTFVYPVGRRGNRSAILYRYTGNNSTTPNISPYIAKPKSSIIPKWSTNAKQAPALWSPNRTVIPEFSKTDISDPLSKFSMTRPEERGDADKEDLTNVEQKKDEKKTPPIIVAPHTTNNGGNTTINNNTVNNYNIHHDDAARAEWI